MAQETFASWNAASSSNATIEGDGTDGSVSVAEGNLPGTVNNAIRTIMAACNLAYGDLPSGTSRPSYLTAGRMWKDTTTATAPIFKVYDGTDDTTLFTVNYTTNSVTFNGSVSGFDITGLTALTAPAAADEIPLYDASAMANRKVAPEDFFKLIDTITAETAPATGDEVVIYDASAADSRKMTLANLLAVIASVTAETAPATGDSVLLYDTSAGGVRNMTLANLWTIINSFTALTSGQVDTTNDFIPVYDASAGALKKVAPTNLGITGSSGSVAQVVFASTATRSTLAVTPLDDTIPQITEGTEIVTAAITPTNASSTILIECTVQCANGSNGESTTAHVHVDATADAIGATSVGHEAAPRTSTIALTCSHSPGDTSAHTYRLRAGESAGTGSVNGSDSGGLFSTVGPLCTIKLTEILP